MTQSCIHDFCLQECDSLYSDVSASVKQAEEALNRHKTTPSQLEVTEVIALFQVCCQCSEYRRLTSTSRLSVMMIVGVVIRSV